ncbi:MAG: PHP domain-containing protein [Patescibacteria group bacterium]
MLTLSRDGAGIPADWLGVDMHVHSAASDGLPCVDTILERAKRRGIGVAITDHNTIAGSIEACEKANDVVVVPGIEVSSDQNVHMLVYFRRPSELESFFLRVIEPHCRSHLFCKGIHLPATDILASAKELSGFSALAHPYGNGRFHCIADEMRTEILALLDGIEICNGVQSHRRNDKANLLAQLTKLLRIGGSDAHVACACGHVCTYAPGHDAPSFLDAVGRGTSAVLSYPFSIKEALEDGMTIAMRYLWHAMHRQKVWI